MHHPGRAVANAWQGVQRILHGNLAVFSITSVLGMFGRSMAYSYVSLYIIALGGDPEQIGLINSLAPLLGLVAFPLGGYLADHVGRAKLIGWTMIAAASMELLYAIAPGWQWLAVGSLLMGLGVVQFPSSSSLVADSTLPQDRSRAIGLMNALSSLPAMAAPWVAGLVVDRVGVDPGVRYLYAFLGSGNILSGILVLCWLRETRATPPGGFRLASLPALLRSTYGGLPDLLRQVPRTARTILAITILGLAVNAIAGPFWVVYVVDYLHLSATAWGTILLIESVVRIVGMTPAGALSDRVGRSRCMAVALAMLAVALPLFILVKGYWGVLAVRLLVGVATALFVPSSIALLADSIPRAIRGRAMAAIGQGGVMIGASSGGTGGPALGYLVTLPLMATSFVAGYIFDASPTLPWIVSLGLVVIAMVLALVYLRDPHQAEA